MTLITAVCPYCEQEFTYQPKGGPRRVYCTPEHRVKAQQRIRIDRAQQLERRRCARCKQTKPTAQFAGASTAYCKPCFAEYERDRRAAGKASTPDYTRIVTLRRYGLTPEKFDLILASQGGRCAICRTDEPGYPGWQVDHDHACCPRSKRSCGRCRRGILCSRCNFGVGNFRDDPAILRAALEYVVAARERIQMPQ